MFESSFTAKSGPLPAARVRPRCLAFLAALLLVTASSDAALEADLATSRGVVTVVLEHAKAPRAVANFMTLAEGRRSWVDSRSGAVSNDPLFGGLAFHQVVNTSGDKRAACGSRDGSGSDRPGFTIQDDLDSSLTHQPYVIAFASDGPNTGGSRFYLTGNVTMSQRDGRDVVFGSIPSTASRQVVDQILAAGAGSTTLQAVTIRRTDPAAVGFDELAVPLPAVTAPSSAVLSAMPGAAVTLGISRMASTTLRASASSDLVAWTPVFRNFIGPDDAVPPGTSVIETAVAPRRFYHFAVTDYPDAGGAAGFANRTLVIHTPGTGEITYTFDATGLAGTYLNVPLPGFPLTFSGPFTVRTEIPAEYDAYRFSILIYADGLGGSPMNWIRGGFDVVSPSSVGGRQVTSFYDASMSPVFEDSGSLWLSRP